MIANRLKQNFISGNLLTNFLWVNKNLLINWMNNCRCKMNSNVCVNNFEKKEKFDFSYSIMKFHKEQKKSFPYLMFFALSKLWKEMSIFLTSTFKRKKLKMKKHKTAKRIKKLRNIQKSNLKKK